MIVTRDASEPIGYVVLQKDHAALAGQMAAAFGNETFAELEPKALMEFLVVNHDRGWDAADERVQRDAHTGLPYSLVKTPLAELLATGPASVAFNAAHHPYCGLLAAMHVYGLFHGRYGLSDKVVMDFLAGEAKAKAQAMLQDIAASRDLLLSELKANPKAAAWVQPDRLMQNYKALQLFDTLSLYCNEACAGGVEPTQFLNVPRNAVVDVTIKLTPLGQHTYHLDPYPFRARRLTLELDYYEVPVLGMDVDYRLVLDESPRKTALITMVA